MGRFINLPYQFSFNIIFYFKKNVKRDFSTIPGARESDEMKRKSISLFNAYFGLGVIQSISLFFSIFIFFIPYMSTVGEEVYREQKQKRLRIASFSTGVSICSILFYDI